MSDEQREKVIVEVGIDDQQAKAELDLLAKKIHEIINDNGQSKTFAELKKDIKGITEFTKLMKVHGGEGTREFTALTEKAKELKVYASAIRKDFGEVSNNTFENIALQAERATTETHKYGQALQMVNTDVQHSNQGMSKMHGLLEFADRTSSVEGLGGAFGFLNSMLGFSTMAMGEYASAQGQAERAAAAAEKAQQALAAAQNEGRNTTNLATAAQEANEVATQSASSATKAFRMALISIGIGVFILGLQTLIENWDKVVGVLSKVTARQNELNNITKEAIKTAASEVAQLRYLYTVSTDVTKSKEQRLAATKKLQDQYPSYFKNMSTEQIMLGKATKAYNDLTNAIMASARAKAAQSKLEAFAAEELEMEDSYGKLIESNSKKAKEASGADKKYWQNVTDQSIKAREERRKTIAEQSKFYQDFLAQNQKIAEPLEKDRANAPKAATATKDDKAAEQRKKELEEIAELERAARLANENAWLNSRDVELKTLRESFEKTKALYTKHGKDLTEITEQYNRDKQTVNDKYDSEFNKKQEEKNQKEIEAQKQADEALRKLQLDNEKEILTSLEMDADADIFPSMNAKIEAINKYWEQKKYIEELQFEEEKLRLGEQHAAIELLTVQHQNRIQDIEGKQNKEVNAIRKESADKGKEINNKNVDSFIAMTGGIGEAIGAMGELMEEQTLGQKALAMSSVVIDMLASIMATWKGYASMNVAGAILAGAQTAFITATGIKNLREISKVKVNGKTGNNSVPTIDTGAFNTAPLISAQQAIQDESNVRITNDDFIVKAYITDSDLADSEKRQNYFNNLGDV